MSLFYYMERSRHHYLRTQYFVFCLLTTGTLSHGLFAHIVVDIGYVISISISRRHQQELRMAHLFHPLRRCHTKADIGKSSSGAGQVVSMGTLAPSPKHPPSMPWTAVAKGLGSSLSLAPPVAAAKATCARSLPLIGPGAEIKKTCPSLLTPISAFHILTILVQESVKGNEYSHPFP